MANCRGGRRTRLTGICESGGWPTHLRDGRYTARRNTGTASVFQNEPVVGCCLNDEKLKCKNVVQSPYPAGLEVQDSMTKVERHQAGLALLLAITLLVGWRPLVDTLALAWGSDEYTYILLILPVSVAMIYLEWPSLRTMLALSVRACFRIPGDRGFDCLRIACLVSFSAFRCATFD